MTQGSSDSKDSAALPPALPKPMRRKRPHVSLWLIWLIPLTAVIVGLTLGVKALTDRGPNITIRFRNGEGIEAAKTRIKLKDVDVGIVRAVRLAPDLSEVEVTAELLAGPTTNALLKKDTRFWVVRPRVGPGGVSGLSTLLSGAYIGVDPGKDAELATSFRGLDTQPPITADVPGTEFKLVADDLGSLDIGSPIYYRRVPVGQVSSYQLAQDGKRIVFTIFVAAPYDRFVTLQSRFWQASGVDVALDSQGVRIDTQSLASIVSGGIAFADGPGSESAQTGEVKPAARDAEFRLYARQLDAMRRPDGVGFDYRLLFTGSVRGLIVGAPVEYRGLPIGEVTQIAVEGIANAKNPNPRIAVDVRVYPTRLPSADGKSSDAAVDQKARLNPMIAKGFRAQLRTGNVLTGQLYVALDFFPNEPASRINWAAQPPIFPTVPGSFDELQDSLVSLARKLDKLPLETLAQDLHKNLTALHADLKRAESLLNRLDNEVAPELTATLKDARSTMTELRRAIGTADGTIATSADTLIEVQKAAKSLRTLADYLERHPEALLRGKPEDPK